MAVQTTAGTTLSLIATAPATYDAAGFATLSTTMKEVGEIVDIGEWGREYNLVTHNPIGDRRTVKLKGSYNDGQIALQLGRDITDEGQLLLKAALDDDADYSFMITFQDGSIQYFGAKVMSYTTNGGGVDQVLGASVVIEISGDTIEA